ncbi:hypothetical protein E6Q11_02175 [Candidatus Dojkabacteria bacterium]|uniref:Uncharacterized protein n=1 Tax=Candidatus Dojkabacteria bacterium TaxID=2099670 RepID=A0A5C7J8A8_9BACT|nr:MAG: hypothetical protein E6Q11_02175 [Candidatus Dojkabacteria bacterium]
MPSYQRDAGLVSAVKSLENDTVTIKSAQSMGNDIVNMQTYTNPSAYDFTVSGFSSYVTNITYNTGNQANPNGWVYFNVWRGSVGTLAVPESFDITIQDTNFNLNDFKLTWLGNFWNHEASTLYFKVYIVASD